MGIELRIWDVATLHAPLAMLGFLYSSFDPWRGILFYLSCTFLLSSGFTLNNIADYKQDLFNPYRERTNLKEAKRGAVVSLALSISLFSLFFPHLLPLALLCYFLLLIYSFPPRIRERPPFDTLLHSIGGGYLAFLLGVQANRALVLKDLVVAMLPMVISAAYHVEAAIMHYEYDKLAGAKTIATFYGKSAAKKALLAFSSLCFFPCAFHLWLSPLLLFLCMISEKMWMKCILCIGAGICIIFSL